MCQSGGANAESGRKSSILEQIAAAHCRTKSPHTTAGPQRVRHQRGRLAKIVVSTRHLRRGDQEIGRALSRSPPLPLCSRHQVPRRGALPATVPVTVMSRAAKAEVPRLRSTAPRDRHDVVQLQEEA